MSCVEEPAKLVAFTDTSTTDEDAEGNAVEGNAVEGDAAKGDAVEGDAVEGNAAKGNAAKGNAAKEKKLTQNNTERKRKRSPQKSVCCSRDRLPVECREWSIRVVRQVHEDYRR